MDAVSFVAARTVLSIQMQTQRAFVFSVADFGADQPSD